MIYHMLKNHENDSLKCNRRCDDECIFRQIVPYNRRNPDSLWTLRCLLFDTPPYFKYCVLSEEEYLDYYNLYTVIDGELQVKNELMLI